MKITLPPTFYSLRVTFYALLTCLLFTTTGKAQDYLYGMTSEGGTDDLGVIFRTDVEGQNQEVVFEFTTPSPGSNPYYSHLTQASNGKMYGMTSLGGSNGYGVLFEYNPTDGSYTKKIDFDGSAKGRNPYGSLTESGGKLYGMTVSGGTNNRGVLFEYNPSDGSFTKKIDFNFSNGSTPYGSLTESGGKLYGMTQGGGVNAYGVLFEYDPLDESFTKKIDFSPSKGTYPYGSLTNCGGKLYGMTQRGGGADFGVLFEYDPSDGSLTAKIQFDGFAKGRYPFGSLTESGGKLYGMTASGGSSNRGVLFEYNPTDESFTKKIDFDGTSKGRNPYGSLTESGGKLYGMTAFGGNDDLGVLFVYDPSDGSFTKKIDFDGNDKGINPYGSLSKSGGKLYGMTRLGGSSGYGVLFEFDPLDGSFNKKIDFDHSLNGSRPFGSLTEGSGKLYGLTRNGGSAGLGVLFEFDPSEGILIKKVDFDGIDKGKAPHGSLTEFEDKLYAMTFSGGSNGNGVLFEFNPANNSFSKKVDFDGADKGRSPYGSLTEVEGKLYGMTASGGNDDRGVLFEYNPTDESFTKKIDFDGTSKGSNPYGSLTESGGKLYGMTAFGGNDNLGVLFEYDPSDGSLTKKIDFDGTSKGRNPYGSLTEVEGKLFGMARIGGSSNQGVLFEYNPSDGSFIKRINFDGTAKGQTPFGSLTEVASKLYGMTFSGGNGFLGVLFEYNPSDGSFTKTLDFDGTNGSRPYYGHLTLLEAPLIAYWNAEGDALNWSDPNNWANDEVPGAGDEVMLDNTTVLGVYTVTISGNEEVGDLTLDNSNIKVNIATGASLTYGTIESNGTLTVKSGGNLFPTGAGTLTGTGFKVERTNPAPTKANFWSSPVVNGHTSMIGGKNTQALNPLTQEYSPASGMMSVGKGYFSNQATTAVFSGTPNNGDIDVNVFKDPSLPGYNLIGNPYPSGLIAKSFTDANSGGVLTAAALYLFSQNNPFGSYESAQDIVIVNTLGSAFYNNSEDLDTYVIASGQGFGVEAANNGTVSFTNAMRSTDNNNFKAGEDAVKVWVAIKNQTHEYSTLVAFTEDATYGADYEFDAPTYFGANLAIASTIKDKTYGIQAVPQLESGYNQTVGLKLNIPVAGNHTFEVAKSEKLPQGVKVYIHDKNTNYYFDITNNKRQLAISAAGEVDRYELVVGDAALSTSIADKIVTGAEAYVSENTLNISSAEGITGFTLIDMKGSVVMQQSVANNQEVSVQLPNNLSGIYLLQVQTVNGIETVKLSID